MFSSSMGLAVSDSQNCSQYSILSQRIEALSCEKSNQEYLMNFGHRYCVRFMSAGILVENEIGKVKWSAELEIARGRKLIQFRRWIWGTMKCLQEELSNYIESDPGLTCSSLRSRAFVSHRKCYETNGFCDIYRYWDDIVFKIIGFQELIRMLPQSTEMIGICSPGF